jgi:hypothetical protein
MVTGIQIQVRFNLETIMFHAHSQFWRDADGPTVRANINDRNQICSVGVWQEDAAIIMIGISASKKGQNRVSLTILTLKLCAAEAC